MKSHQRYVAIVYKEKAKKTVLKGWMQRARIAVHCQGTTEESAVRRKEGHNFLKKCNCFFGTFLVLHPNYMNYFQFKLLAIRQHI